MAMHLPSTVKRPDTIPIIKVNSVERMQADQTLRDIFDMIDQTKQGFIRLEDFYEYAAHYSGGNESLSLQQKERLGELLDPHSIGSINFENFCNGAATFVLENEVVPSENITTEVDVHIDADDKDDIISNSTYNEYDISEEENNNQRMNDRSGPSLLENIEVASDGYAKFFENGTSHGIDHWPLSDEELEIGSSASGPSHKVKNAISIRSHHSLTEFDKRRNQMMMPVRGHQRTDSNFSAFSNASSLMQMQRYSRNSSPRPADDTSFSQSFTDAETYHLSEKIRTLESQIENIQASQEQKENKHLRLKADKEVLEHKLHLLDEQLNELRAKHERKIEKMNLKFREEKVALESDYRMQLDEMKQKLNSIEDERKEAKLEVPRLKGQLDIFRENQTMLEDKLREKDEQLVSCRREIDKRETELEHILATHKNESIRILNEASELKKEVARLSEEKEFYKSSRRNSREEVEIVHILEENSKLKESYVKAVNEKNSIKSKLEMVESSPCGNCGGHTPISRTLSGYSAEYVEPDGSTNLAQELALVFQSRPRAFTAEDTVEQIAASGKSYQELCAELRTAEVAYSELKDYLSRLLVIIMENKPELLELK